MVESMAPTKQMKQLMKNTSRAFSYTCKGMVELSNYLLNTTHQYVCLRNFTSDPIEKMFGKLSTRIW